MKNKIKRISKGDFDVIEPDIRLSHTKIVMQIGEGALYEGSFTLQNKSEGDIRGLVYTSSYRVAIKEQGFEGNPVVIHYTFDGTGMVPGNVEEGTFTIVCDGGEFEISFTAVVEKPYIMTEYGKIQNLKDLKNLAMTDFMEAHKVFRSKRFLDLMKYEEAQVLALYSNMRKWELDEQALEEFLVGTKQKERIFVTFQEDDVELDHIFEPSKESVVITKNTWGFLPIRIETDSDFIEISRKEITTDDFVGANYYLDYMIETKALHHGKNYGRIFAKTPYETICFTVVVHQDAVHHEHHGEASLFFGNLLKSYMACICGRMGLETWTTDAVAIVKQLREIDPKNEMYELLLAHVFIRGGKIEEAMWVLENHNYSRFSIGRKPEVNAYYLFLNTIVRKDDVLQKKTVEELNRISGKHPELWQVLCMLVNVDPKYRNYSERLQFLRTKIEGGSRQVLVLLEAYICYQERTSLLKKLGTFELQILNFASKYRMITKELALYTANLASQEKNYQDVLYQILVRTYKMYEDPMTLSAICTLLIKGNKSGKEYFKWYQRAILQGMKIAQLFEYYMMSINEERVNGPLPRIVYLYFAYGNTLDYKKTALLYANLLTYEDEESELFQSYRDKIQSFAWEQLLKRRINEHLRVIYKRFCSEPGDDLERMKAIYDVSNSYLIETKVPNMKYVLVLEEDGTISQKIPYKEGGTRILMYHKTSEIIWESNDGRHYTTSIPFDMRRLFYEPQFVEMYKQKESLLEPAEEEPRAELTMDHLKKYGLDYFGEEVVFRYISRKLREEQITEDDDLTHFCYRLLERGQYDKVILSYLAKYYCGATRSMKKVWKVARDYEVNTYNLAERIITQMLFTETMFQEEPIFQDYYQDGGYFRLRLGYLAYVSYEYVLKERVVGEQIIQMIFQQFETQEDLAEVCMIAAVKFYASHPYQKKEESILKTFLRMLCEKQLIFPFFLQYPEEWLRELLLYDHSMIEYHAAGNGKVKLTYTCRNGSEFSEQLLPTYGNIYVKSFVLFHGEEVHYTFREEQEHGSILEQSGVLKIADKMSLEGKYGKINEMCLLDTENLQCACVKYEKELEMAETLFLTY